MSSKSLNSQLNGGIISEFTRAIEENEKSIRTEKIELLNEIKKSLSEKKLIDIMELKNESRSEKINNETLTIYKNNSSFSAKYRVSNFLQILVTNLKACALKSTTILILNVVLNSAFD